MKQKILIGLVSTYLILILVILVIGLNFQGTNNPMMTGTGVAPDTTTSQPVENEFQFSKTAIETANTQTSVEPELSPSLEPSKTQTITAVSQEPTQSTPSPPTSTPPAYPVSGEETPIATTTPPSYPVEDLTTPTFSPTSTTTPSHTSTTQTGWGGEWRVFWEQSDGSYLSALMLVSIDGSDMTASVSMGEEQVDFEGVLNESSVTVVGSWQGIMESGNFYWRSILSDHFAGSLNRQLGFCGVRQGVGLPEGCKKIPSDL